MRVFEAPIKLIMLAAPTAKKNVIIVLFGISAYGATMINPIGDCVGRWGLVRLLRP